MAKIKVIFEDFIVKEITNIDLLPNGANEQIWFMRKQNYTTERAVSQVARSLRIPRKFIGYAGSKDKNAITYQNISLRSRSKEKINSLNLKDIQLEFKGYSKNKLKLGSLKGNKFEIVLRDLPHNFEINEKEEFLVPNYFDNQRFSNANLEIGILILQNKFKEAVELIKNTDRDFQQKIENHLEKRQNDFIGAINLLPKKTTLFYIHSVQSYFFNNLLSQKIELKYKAPYKEGELIFNDQYTSIEKLPLVGYLTENHEELLSSKNLNARNFLIRSLPQFSLEGGERKAFFKVKNFKAHNLENDEKNEGKKKIKLEFELCSGSYATIVIKYILSKRNLILDN